MRCSGGTGSRAPTATTRHRSGLPVAPLVLPVLPLAVLVPAAAVATVVIVVVVAVPAVVAVVIVIAPPPALVPGIPARVHVGVERSAAAQGRDQRLLLYHSVQADSTQE